MEWIFSYGAKRNEIIRRLLSIVHGQTIAHELKGNTLWAVKKTDGAPYIACFRIAQQHGKSWGYLELREQRYTPCNCPLQLLELAPAIDLKWRERVYQYHARDLKAPCIGETWALKHSPIPHVLIQSITPRLEGIYAGRTYRVSQTQLAMPLRGSPLRCGHLAGGVA